MYCTYTAFVSTILGRLTLISGVEGGTKQPICDLKQFGRFQYNPLSVRYNKDLL